MIDTNISHTSFITESNKIEGINRQPSFDEEAEFKRFMELDEITIEDLKKFVSVCAPNHVLRNKIGLNVRVGGYYAPAGGVIIEKQLRSILHYMSTNGAYKTHIAYELLHPFTDGNGRSGRALWAWQMSRQKDGWSRQAWHSLGFLHTFYYQALGNARS